jgi:hypothetical protein
MQDPNYAWTKMYIWELFCSAFLNKNLTKNGVLTVYTQLHEMNNLKQNTHQ